MALDALKMTLTFINVQPKASSQLPPYPSKTSAERRPSYSATLTSGRRLLKALASHPMNSPSSRPRLLSMLVLPPATWMPCWQSGSNGLQGMPGAALAMPLWTPSGKLWTKLDLDSLHKNYKDINTHLVTRIHF